MHPSRETEKELKYSRNKHIYIPELYNGRVSIIPFNLHILAFVNGLFRGGKLRVEMSKIYLSFGRRLLTFSVTVVCSHNFVEKNFFVDFIRVTEQIQVMYLLSSSSAAFGNLFFSAEYFD